jgi:hypothetical protein
MNGDQLTRSLTQQYGPFLSGKDLMRNLGFRSHSSFARARKKGLLEVAVFDLEGRRGPFALTQEVAEWMAALPAKKAAEPGSATTEIKSEEEAS